MCLLMQTKQINKGAVHIKVSQRLTIQTSLISSNTQKHLRCTIAGPYSS